MLIFVGSIAQLILTVGQYCCHYKMMMRWYVEHPIDGNIVARSISVGLPPDDSMVNKNTQREG